MGLARLEAQKGGQHLRRRLAETAFARGENIKNLIKDHIQNTLERLCRKETVKAYRARAEKNNPVRDDVTDEDIQILIEKGTAQYKAKARGHLEKTLTVSAYETALRTADPQRHNYKDKKINRDTLKLITPSKKALIKAVTSEHKLV